MFKYKRKSLTALVLAFTMSLSLWGCGSKNDKATEPVTEISTDVSSATTISEANSSDKEITTEDTTSKNSEADNTTDTAISTSNNTTTSPATTQEVINTDNSTSTDVSDSTSANDDTTSVISETILSKEEAEQKRFDEYLDKAFRESVVKDSITLHYTLSHPENYGITPPEVTYGSNNLSEEGLATEKKTAKKELKELESFDYSLLTRDQQFNYDVLHDLVTTNIQSYDYIYLYEPFAYTSGLHSNFPITLSEYKLQDKEDVDTYLKLLELAPDYFQTYLSFENKKISKGLFMNTNSANEVIRQCKDFISNPENNLMIETFNNNIIKVEGLTADEIDTYKKANYDAVMNYIIPTYEKVIEFFKANRKAGKNELGLAHFENGTDYYKYLIMSKVGSDKTPEEIIELLDSEIKSLMGQMTTTAITKYDAYMSYIEDYDELYEDINPKETILYFEEAVKDRFPEIPAIDFTVEPVHESLEDIVSPAFFMQPQMDDYKNNRIYTNLDKEGSNSLWSTLAHEGVPGHMYQFVYFLSSDPEPIRTVVDFTGYTEGWATYTELMSFDYYDKYANDCYADLEKINTMLNLLVSARVEIGVNYEGWDLEQTENYLTKNGFSAEVAEKLMNYVIAEPGNYQMYVLGWLEFKELREYAEEELGDKFNEVEFHKVILDAGPCQFYRLRELVEEYVLSK